MFASTLNRVAEDIGKTLWDKVSLWRFGWRYLYDKSPLPTRDRVKKEWKRFLEKEVVPEFESRSDEIVAVVQRIFTDAAKNPKVRSAVRRNLSAIIDDPEVHRIVWQILREVMIDSPRVRQVLAKIWTSPEAKEAFQLASSRFEPTAVRIGELLFGTPEGGITPEFAAVLRRQILLKDQRWLLLSERQQRTCHDWWSRSDHSVLRRRKRSVPWSHSRCRMTDQTEEPIVSPRSGMSVSLIDLTIRVGERVLLEEANVHFEPGRVSLIVGCSGAGKSVLLRTLAGLIRKSDPVVKVAGRVACTTEGHDPNPNKNPIGIVFQNFALFDEFSAMDNVRFAESHRSRGRDAASATQLLDALDVPRATPTSALSGGQKQRLAIARTLAFAPDVVLYDEPTSGLDAVTAHRVAKMIGETHEKFPKTSIIVTHDYESLPTIADDIFLFDPATRSLTKVPRDDWTRLPQLLQHTPIKESEPQEPTTFAKLKNTVLGGLGDFFDLTTRATLTIAESPLSVLPIWRSPKWGMRYLLHYLRLIAGPSAWAYVVIAGHDPRLCRDILHVQVPAVRQLHRTAPHREPPALNGLRAVSHFGSRAHDYPDRCAIRRGGGFGYWWEVLRQPTLRHENTRREPGAVSALDCAARIPDRYADSARHLLHRCDDHESVSFCGNAPRRGFDFLGHALPPRTADPGQTVLCRNRLASHQDPDLRVRDRVGVLLPRRPAETLNPRRLRGHHLRDPLVHPLGPACPVHLLLPGVLGNGNVPLHRVPVGGFGLG